MAEQINNGLNYEAECVEAVPEEKKRAAAEFLTNELPVDVKKTFKKLIEKGTSRSWFSEFHSFTGMKIRNLLRQNGFSEEELGIPNLDFIYCKLLERAIVGSEINWGENNGI